MSRFVKMIDPLRFTDVIFTSRLHKQVTMQLQAPYTLETSWRPDCPRRIDYVTPSLTKGSFSTLYVQN